MLQMFSQKTAIALVTTSLIGHLFVLRINRLKARVQHFEKKDGEIFIRESRPRAKSWLPRITTNVDFFDPYHKAALCFLCYASESDGAEGELLKIRPMKLTFHLDEETFSMTEPYIGNSGHVQGRIFYRQKVPKEKSEEPIGLNFITWRNIRLGEDISMFGRKYRIVSCDNFTRNFYQDRGIPMNDLNEEIPIDAWTMKRHFGKRERPFNTDALESLHINDDTDHRSWNDLPSNLIFNVAWLDAENDFHGSPYKRTFRMLANTSDDTVTLTETTAGFNNAIFLRNVRLPYLTPSNVQRHYRVVNMRPGMWIDVFKRSMFIYDCEGEHTTQFIKQQYGNVQFGHCSIEILKRGPPPKQFHCRPAQLLFMAKNDEFPKTEFIVIYNFNDRQVDIYEAGRLRAWSRARPFLIDIDATHIDVKNFCPGNQISLFRWNFHITEAHPNTQIYLNSLQQSTPTIVTS